MLNPKYVPALRKLGLAYANLGNVDKALEKWQNALAFNPNDILTLVYLGRTLTEQRGDANGMIYLRKAYRLAPKNPAVLEGYTRGRKLFSVQ
jgi:cytochrome c-type biogenesis protein CcmH/NrfG